MTAPVDLTTLTDEQKRVARAAFIEGTTFWCSGQWNAAEHAARRWPLVTEEPRVVTRGNWIHRIVDGVHQIQHTKALDKQWLACLTPDAESAFAEIERLGRTVTVTR